MHSMLIIPSNTDFKMSMTVHVDYIVTQSNVI